MKFQIDKFLTLTAMMATAQLGVLACTTDPEDGTDESGEDAGADDDQGSSDDDAADDDSADDDAADDDVGDDDVAGGDAGAEGDRPVDAGDLAPEGDAGAPTADAGALGDAGTGGALGDAGDEGALGDAGEGELPMGDAAVEGGECLGGGLDPAQEAVDCAMFDECDSELYMGGTWCWDMSTSRRESVYAAFIGCIMDEELADPCTEAGDYLVSVCAAAADAEACVEPDEGCAAMAESCSEIDAAACDATFAPLSANRRYDVTACFDYYYSGKAETYGPDYEGCGYDLAGCLSPSGE